MARNIKAAIQPPAQLDLFELAERINAAHADAVAAAGKLAGDAMQIGQWLLEAQRQVLAEGLGWISWVRANLTFGEREAQRYLKVADATRVSQVPDQDDVSLRGLLRALSPPPPVHEPVEPVELPAGKYETLVVDPPWPMQKIEREVRPNQVGFDYPTMDEDELAAFPLADIAADDCHLFLWTTHRFLPMAMRLAEGWGFRYVCLFTWMKPGGFQPVGLPQFNTEFAIYARKGSPKFVDTKAFPTGFQAPRREHSRKPDEFYDVVARVTYGPRIEVFAREERDGFERYGNEPDRFAS